MVMKAALRAMSRFLLAESAPAADSARLPAP